MDTLYEIWDGDEFIDWAWFAEACRLAEAGYTIKPADGYGP